MEQNAGSSTQNVAPDMAQDLAQDLALDTLAEARGYTLRTLKQFRGQLSSPVLEIGAGTGNITVELLGQGHDVTATELNENRLEYLRKRVTNEHTTLGGRLKTAALDLSSLTPEKASQLGRFRSVVAFNVIEHIGDDVGCLKSLKACLEPGGSFCMVVPAHPWLYSRFDRAIGHYRRYTTGTAAQLFHRAGYEVESIRYFNSVAVLGWLLNFRLLGRTKLPGNQVKFFDFLGPVFELEDRVKMPFGLSVLAVGRTAR